MKNLLASAVAAGVLLGLPLAAGAADTMDKMDKMDKPGMMMTMMCRPAMEKEKTMTGVMMMGKTPVVCKTITPAMMKKMEAGPAVSSSLTTMQVNDAWKKFVMESVEIPGVGGGG